MRFHKDGTQPKNGEIFVFGSNLAGRHGAGAAKAAKLHFGAVQGIGYGLVNNSFGIPTKDTRIMTLSLSEIKRYIDLFIDFSNKRPHLRFFITRIGCGLAGYEDKDIAPMFKGAGDNCSFAYRWKKYLEEK